MAQNAISAPGLPGAVHPFLLPQVRRQVQQQMIAWQVESWRPIAWGCRSRADLRNELRTGVFGTDAVSGRHVHWQRQIHCVCAEPAWSAYNAEFEKDMKDDMERRRLRELRRLVSQCRMPRCVISIVSRDEGEV